MSNKQVLLTSESFVKEVTNLSDNLSGKLLLPAIREAQSFGLKNIIGTKIYKSLLDKVLDGSIYDEANEKYKELLDVCQYYLAYSVATNVILLSAVKVDNIGVVRTTDERVESVAFSDLASVRGYYQKKADYYASQIQKYLKDVNYFESSCNTNTYSSASTDIWLGGARGKIISNC